MVDLKRDIFKFCEQQLNSRLASIAERIRSLQESLESESKSSAGDKHETGRAMLHLEREKLGQQLLSAEKSRALLNMVNTDNQSEKISLGSLVRTSAQSYFIAISAGEYKKGSEQVFCISPSTPIGRLLLGNSKGDSFTFNDKSIKINEVL